MNGASLVEIADMLGHRTLQMVRRYAHLSESHVKGVESRRGIEREDVLRHKEGFLLLYRPRDHEVNPWWTTGTWLP
jgi:hypothetical protein